MPTGKAVAKTRHRRSPGNRLSRAALGASLFAVAILGGHAAASTGRPAPARHAAIRTPSKPNIVVILVDDLGWPDVSTYGRTDVPTPNIDRIAASGVAFSSGYVAASVCAVSRAGLLTGRMPQRFGFTYNINDAGGDDAVGLPTSEKTLADRLKPLGYRTAAIGKWHQGSRDPYYPTNRGFDEFYGFLAGETVYVDPRTPGMVTTPTKADHYAIDARKPNGSIVEGPDRHPVDNFSHYLTNEITDHAVDFIHRSSALHQPFFAYVAYNAPHWPLQVPQAWYDKFPQIKDPVRRTYVAMIAALDAGVGQILDTLDKEGVRRNTMVVFLSDNGCPVQFGFCNVAHPWGWGKFSYLEGGIRVPFMMSWPAGLKPHGVVDTPVSSLDITPTVLRAAAPGRALPAGLDGVDLLSTVAHPPRVARTLIWGQEPVYAARRGPLKYWRSVDLGQSDLYDLDQDLWERTDLTADRPDAASSLAAATEAWRRSLPAPLWKRHDVKSVTAAGHKTELVY